MKRFHILIALLLLSWGVSAQNHFDIVVVGGNPGGIMTAIAAARQGKTSVILERTRHIGGLPANGLGAKILPLGKRLPVCSWNLLPGLSDIMQIVTEKTLNS